MSLRLNRSTFNRHAEVLGNAVLVTAAAVLGSVSAFGGIDWPNGQYPVLAEGFNRPVDIQSPPNGTNDLYIVEKPGIIRILAGGEVLLTEPFLDINVRVIGGTSDFDERGLLGLAFDPDFASNGYFYANYTAGETRVSRFSIMPGNPYQADPNSEDILFTVVQPFSNHNGGQLQFGPDGFLYIGLGDGGGANDTGNRAQNPLDLLGKMLRIDVRGDDFPGDPVRDYSIPNDNPFVGNSGVNDEIWALGLRNPWRYSFDSATGDLFIADVGQQDWEEVNSQNAGSDGGENYGWRVFEGTHSFNPSPGLGPGQLVDPIEEYPHGTTGNCSITGGYVYRGVRYPRMEGVYFYADWCSGRIWGLQQDGANWAVQEIDDTVFGITSFGVDGAGNLFFADQGRGNIYRVTDTVEAEPPWPQLEAFELIGSGLGQPTDIRHCGDGSDRLFIAQNDGTVSIFKDGALLQQPFLNLTDRVKADAGDEGFSSIAFPPGFAQKQVFYVAYTRTGGQGLESVVSRIQVSGDLDVADPATEEILFAVDEPSNLNNVDQLQFGRDGFLYVGFGDGGPDGDPNNRSQDPTSLHGKILRIDTENVPPAGKTYGIPPDNPFAGDDGVMDEIWALGLRDPRRFSLDPETGDLFIGDVGSDDWDEINVENDTNPRGRNFGWRIFEGRHDFNDASGFGPGPVTFPAVEIAYVPGDNSVTAGYVYRGESYPQMKGIFYFADLHSGDIWGMQLFGGEWITKLLVDTDSEISTFGLDESGNLLFADFSLSDSSGGRILHIGDAARETVLPREVAPVRDGGNRFSFSFPTLPGRNMQVQVTEDAGQTWQDLGVPITGSGATQTFTDQTATFDSSNSRLYRAVLTDGS